jgi:hypothetical protein
MELIGREKEIEELERIWQSGNSEFVAIYGRRRVGKTYLVKTLFENRMAFWHTGMAPHDSDRKNQLYSQLQTFFYSLQDYGLQGGECPKTWLEAFRMLENLLVQKDDGSRQVVFIDELPWMDTARSNFIPAFEHFWNGWASKRGNIMLIVCGSATSWIENNLINNKGGLYNRLTAEIKLSPFTLGECESYFREKKMSMSRYDVATAYMVFGGIPHYLSLFEKGLSVAQNIDALLFARSAKLRNEFGRLFGSLFSNPADHIAIVRCLAQNSGGFSRKEILEKTGIKDGGGASEMLKGLIESDFIVPYRPFGGSRVLRYKLTDPFCLFYLYFIDNQENISVDFWQKNNLSSKLNAWRGLAFERLCFSHIAQIKSKLGILGVSSTESAWIVTDSQGKPTSQIDMVIDRSDNVVNLCEIKFYTKPFTIDRKYDVVLRERTQTLIENIQRKKTVHLTFIAAYGIAQNEYSGQVQNVVTLDDLF